MVDFANDFPDAEIFDMLGDDISLLHPNGKTTTIKGSFDFEYEEDELGDRLSMKIPILLVSDDISAQIGRDHLIRYNGVTYSIYNRMPTDTGLVTLVLRSVRSV